MPRLVHSPLFAPSRLPDPGVVMANPSCNGPEPPARRFGLPVRMFGPVFVYDLARHARRPRSYFGRVAYVALLLLLLCILVASQSGGGDSPGVAPEKMAGLTEGFFYAIFAAQFLLTLVLTPAYVAPAVAEEKERKTLELLLTTDLDGVEIILGKLSGRLGRLGLLQLASLPVLSAVQFLGGVEPALVLAGFAATALAALSLGGVAILTSVYARQSGEAILMTGCVLMLYLSFCCAGEIFILSGAFSPTQLFRGGPSAVDLVRTFEAGCPVHALFRRMTGSAGPEVILSVLPTYAAFHLLVAAGTVTMAALRLRPVALRQMHGPERKAVRRAGRRPSPPVGDRAMVWKECYFKESQIPWPKLFRAVSTIPGLLPAVFVYLAYLYGYRFGYRESVATGFNLSVRLYGTAITWSFPLGAAVLGAQAVWRERDKETLDGLLTSPLSTGEILSGMWAGCVWPIHRMAVMLGCIYLPALLTGGLSPLALPLLVTAILVYTGTLAVVGLWCSVVCRTALRARAATAVSVVALMGGHWLVLGPCFHALGVYRRAEVVLRAQAGLTPPVALAVAFAFPLNSSVGELDDTGRELFPYACVGLVCWAALGGLVWRSANRRFRQLYNRGD